MIRAMNNLTLVCVSLSLNFLCKAAIHEGSSVAYTIVRVGIQASHADSPYGQQVLYCDVACDPIVSL